MKNSLIFRDMGMQLFSHVWEDMQRFTDDRHEHTQDEIWFVEHPPIYTLGLNADPAHILKAGNIPILKIDRGGQVTYHGPGQLIVYVMVDLQRSGSSIRSLVQALETAVISAVSKYGVEAYARRDAPGVYVSGQKLAAIGLRVRRSCTYHGLSVNVDMDLSPYQGINPCGFEDLEVTQLRNLNVKVDMLKLQKDMEAALKKALL
ncbi:MAG: octanoyltransferase [Rhodospirillaceae bacterium]|nr:octanoyltransferase [Rhodospirillaceae bacterium]|tara:strand:+ start:822 stop:1433 length:612 start_codon:yes stop_codon:yes gene_type:complete